MKIFISTSYLLLFLTIYSYGQKKDTNVLTEAELLEEVEFIEKLSYDLTSEIFEKKSDDSTIDKEYKLPWNNLLYTEAQLKTALDTLAKNAVIKIKEGFFSNHVLEFKSSFPEFIDEGLIDIFELSVTASTIQDGKATLQISKDGSSGFGSLSTSGTKDGKSYSHLWRTINKSFDIKTEIKTNNQKGTVVFESGFINGYDYLNITSSDIGKEIKIGEYTFTIIDILENAIVIYFNTNIEGIDFSVINIDKEGYRITWPDISYSSQTLSKDIYLMFKEKPNLSFEDYKKAVHHKFLKIAKSDQKVKETENVFGKKYHIFSFPGKLTNLFLYMPKYISKSFEIKYPDNDNQSVTN